MIVYMLLNTITERVYIGATRHSLEDRWKRHLKDTRAGSNDRLHRALREWSDEDIWSRVVLITCYTIQETSDAEQVWMKTCNSLDGAVGYNDSTTPYHISVQNGLKGRACKTNKTKHISNNRRSKFNDMSAEEQHAFLSECGKRGARRSKELSTKTSQT